ncbi:MAG: bacillithiol biosynthesis deacetylase BshB1 [Flavobacteriales bacterium]|jgi:bacillithiol biosynthesis deacetylase BshB1|nr:bacillithiol biosynthesis deacetylase BshB1 [Flavobacteriales bacterium]
MSETVDILCITAHPDDAEISMAGTILLHVALGHRVGLVELTAGELGTRGTPALRAQEAESARQVLGAGFRYQLGLSDGFFRADHGSLLAAVASIRRHRPRVVLTNARIDRHPDHGRAADLVAEACFLSGLRRIETSHEGVAQEAWRPTTVLHAVQDRWVDPDIVFDITPFWEKKLEALKCFSSQFHDPASREPSSPIARADFLPFLEGRAREMGRLLMVTYGEGFCAARPPGIRDVMQLG